MTTKVTEKTGTIPVETVRKPERAAVPTLKSDWLFDWPRDFDRMFDSFLGGLPLAFSRPTFPMVEMTPRMDVSETDTAYEVTVELPGLDEKDITVTVKDGLLTVDGEKKVEHEDKTHHLMERRYGRFSRSIRLPDGVNEDKIEAGFAKGVLTVTLPREPPAKKESKTIEVKGKN